MEEMHKNEGELQNYFDNLSESELVAYHNTYCQETSHSDDEIFDNDESFFDMFFSDTMKAVRAVCYGEYDYTDDFVKFNGYGNLESSNDATDFIDVDDLINDAFENPERYDIEFIDPNDLEDEELFDYLKENDCSGDITSKDEYSPEEWTRERLETIGSDNDLI